MSKSPKEIARLLTEDPDLMNEASGWKHETSAGMDIIDPETGDEYYVEFVIGGDFQEGEPMVRYYADGSGHPGSPSYWEWDIVDILKVEAHDDRPIQLTPELKQKFEMLLSKQIDDEQAGEILGGELPDSSDYADEMYDRWKDEGGHR